MKVMATKTKKFEKRHFIYALSTCVSLGLTLFAPDTFALTAEDTLPELRDVVTTSEKMVKTFCYMIGMSSAAVGGYRFVQTQSLGTGALAGVVSVASFKFPALLTATMVI